jgi:hypothetical protein
MLEGEMQLTLIAFISDIACKCLVFSSPYLKPCDYEGYFRSFLYGGASICIGEFPLGVALVSG